MITGLGGMHCCRFADVDQFGAPQSQVYDVLEGLIKQRFSLLLALEQGSTRQGSRVTGGGTHLAMSGKDAAHPGALHLQMYPVADVTSQVLAGAINEEQGSPTLHGLEDCLMQLKVGLAGKNPSAQQ